MWCGFKMFKLKSPIPLWITLFDNGSNLSVVCGSFCRTIVSISNAHGFISSSEIVWGFLDLATSYVMLYEAISGGLSAVIKLNFGKVAQQSKQALLAFNDSTS